MVRELDEFQLVRYILAYKGTQFISGGIILAIKGGLSYFVLTTFVADDGDDATTSSSSSSSMRGTVEAEAPGVQETLPLEAGDFLSSVLLTWIAAALLPCSLRLGVKEKVADTKRVRDDKAEDAGAKRCCGQGGGGRGGRLLLLLKIDTCWFLFFAVVYAVSMSSAGVGLFGGDSWRAASTLFWVRVCYSLTTFPFLLLTLPVFSKVLTHAERTGFTRDGRCVPFRGSRPAGGAPSDHVDDNDEGGGEQSDEEGGHQRSRRG